MLDAAEAAFARFGAAAVALTATVVLLGATAIPSGPLPERVTFPSADGRTTLVGYVFKPQGPHPARAPAVVMMHGRAGARAAPRSATA